MTDEVRLIHGDCLEAMRGMEAGSVDAVVTDPPAGISLFGKSWDSDLGGRDEWVAWLAERLTEAYRVAKPGSYALVWALPRTSHWTAMALDHSGWAIKDRVTHLLGGGLPKAKSCLKPGAEDWWLACKAGKVAAPLQIDACRIPTDDPDVGRVRGHSTRTHEGWDRPWRHDERAIGANQERRKRSADAAKSLGRWPANVVIDPGPADSLGDPSRFYYTPKASTSDRGIGNDHPCVKNTDLMRWLVRLIAPPGSIILDPFMGSGSTGKAAVIEGFRFAGIESDAGYFAIAERRIAEARAAYPLFA